MKMENIFKYEDSRLEMELDYEKKQKAIKTKKTIFYLGLMLSICFCLFGLYVRSLKASIFGSLSFLAFILLICDCYKRADELNANFHLELEKTGKDMESVNDSLNVTNIDNPTSTAFEYYKKSQKRIIVFTCVTIVVLLMISFFQWLYTFNPNDWQTKPWKRKYMCKDLLKQQDIEDVNNIDHKYNFKFMKDEDIINMLTVPEASNYTPNFTIGGNAAKDCTLVFAYYDKKLDCNMWLLIEKLPNGWNVNLVEDGGYYYCDNHPIEQRE